MKLSVHVDDVRMYMYINVYLKRGSFVAAATMVAVEWHRRTGTYDDVLPTRILSILYSDKYYRR